MAQDASDSKYATNAIKVSNNDENHFKARQKVGNGTAKKLSLQTTAENLY